MQPLGFLHVFSLSFASVGSFDHDIRVFRCIIFEPWVFRFRDLRVSFSSIAYFFKFKASFVFDACTFFSPPRTVCIPMIANCDDL